LTAAAAAGAALLKRAAAHYVLSGAAALSGRSLTSRRLPMQALDKER
jgi:hypothetical protein